MFSLGPLILSSLEYNETNFKSDVYWKRKKRINQICENKKIVSSLNHNPLFVLQDYNVVWCIIPKAGSSIWMANLYQMVCKVE